MKNEKIIIKNESLKKKKYINLLLILLCTPLRASVLIIMPFLSLYIAKKNRLTHSKKFIILVFLFILACINGLVNNNVNIANCLLAGWISIPAIYIYTARVQKNSDSNYFDLLFKYGNYILIIINILGALSYFIFDKSEDAFGFAYGNHFNKVHGLSMINAFFSIYYFSKVYDTYSKPNLYKFLFYTISFLLCFYGLGLIILAASYMIVIGIKSNLRIKIIAFLAFISLVFIISISNNHILTYMGNNIAKFTEQDNENQNARKMIMVTNSCEYILENPLETLIGVGPGGYNGRACYLLNNDSDNPFTKILGNHMPKLHKKYIWDLWNLGFVDYGKYNDGTRNKPFSSFVSIVMENGIIFSVIFFLIFIRDIKNGIKEKSKSPEHTYILLSSIFMLLSLISEMWLETSEFFFFAITIMFARIRINQINNTKPHIQST